MIYGANTCSPSRPVPPVRGLARNNPYVKPSSNYYSTFWHLVWKPRKQVSESIVQMPSKNDFLTQHNDLSPRDAKVSIPAHSSQCHYPVPWSKVTQMCISISNRRKSNESKGFGKTNHPSIYHSAYPVQGHGWAWNLIPADSGRKVDDMLDWSSVIHRASGNWSDATSTNTWPMWRRCVVNVNVSSWVSASSPKIWEKKHLKLGTDTGFLGDLVKLEYYYVK